MSMWQWQETQEVLHREDIMEEQEIIRVNGDDVVVCEKDGVELYICIDGDKAYDDERIVRMW